MMRMIEWLERAAESLGLEVERDYEVLIPGERVIRAPVRVLHLGGPKGMLVFDSFDDAKPYANHLVEAGFGYTVLDEPLANEAFDLESYKEMAADWGWAGPSHLKPSWLST